MAHDALGTYARDELGMSETLGARPLQAAMKSAASFAVGGAMPLSAAAMVSGSTLIPQVREGLPVRRG
jgi:VIT1/CCC1 family predicted Fe2+/Mn2+ transporter